MSDAGPFADFESPLVSLIIVNYNGLAHLSRCLEAVYALDYPSEKLEVVVVDNGSTDGSDELIRQRFPQAAWVRNEVNNYCRANNLGVRHARGAFIGFLNNDVRVDPSWLKELAPVLSNNAQIGGVCGKLLLNDGRLNSTGHVELPHGIWADRGAFEPDIGQLDTLEMVDGLSGAAVLYRRQCIEDVGGFDEDFHMYYEDVDYAVRCRARSWKLVYVPTAIAHHAFHGTATESFVAQQIARNRLLLLAKHWPERLAGALSMPEPTQPVGTPRAVSLLRDLPAVTSKLLKHHSQDGVGRWLPELCEAFGKLIELERQFLTQRLSHEHHASEQLNAELQNAQRCIEALQRDAEESQRHHAVALQDLRNQQEAARLDAERRSEAARLDAERRQEAALQRVRDEHANAIAQVRQELRDLESSTAHRLLVRPLWWVLERLRRPIGAVRHWDHRRILIVKPFHLSVDDTVRAVAELKHRWPQARLTLLANLFPHERLAIERIPHLTSQWLYGPGARPLTLRRLAFLICRAHCLGFAEGVLLVSPSTSGAEAKGTLLLRAVTPCVAYYHADTQYLEPYRLVPKKPRQHSFFSMVRQGGRWLFLGVLALAFVVCIWLPLWWRKRTYRPR